MADSKYQNFGKLTLLALGFFFLYTAYFSTANIASLILEKNGYGPLGFISIGLIYISWGLGSLVSPTIYRKLGQRKSIFLGAISNATWIFSQISTLNKHEETADGEEVWYTSYAFVYFLVLGNSVFNGFFNGPMWVACCKQITSLCTRETYGLYFSYFWTFYTSAQIFGNSLASYVFTNFSQEVFFLVMGSLAAFASFYLTLLPYDDDKRHQNKSEQQTSQNENTPLLEIQDNNKQDSTSVWQDIVDFLTLFVSPKMRFLIPQIFYTGVSISFYVGLFVYFIFKTIDEKQYSEEELFGRSMFAMSMLGCGAIIGTLIVGQVYDRLGHRAACLLNIILLAIASIFLFTFISQQEYNYIPFVMAFTWGMMDSSMATHCYSALGIEFQDSPAGYAIYNFAQSFAVLLFQMIGMYVDTWEEFQHYSLFIVFLGLLFFFTSMFMQAAEKKNLMKRTPSQDNLVLMNVIN